MDNVIILRWETGDTPQSFDSMQEAIQSLRYHSGKGCTVFEINKDTGEKVAEYLLERVR